MKRIKVVYAEDHDRFRQAIAAELEAFQIQVIAQANNGKDLLKLLSMQQPDVVLLDLDMPIMDGNAVLDHIISRWPEVRVIVASMHYEEMLVEDYIRRGAKGFLSKEVFSGAVEILAEAIREVHLGQVYIYQLPIQRESFSTRQKQLVGMMVEGYTNKQMAEEAGIAERSVEKQKQKIYAKVGGERAVDFYRYAFSRGLQFLRKRKGDA